MKQRHSKKYLREQKRDMIRILERSRNFWRAEAAHWHRGAGNLSAIIAKYPQATRTKAHEALERFKRWAEVADEFVKSDRAELKRWRAKRI